MIKMGKYRKLLALLLSVMLLGSTVLLASCGEAETVVVQEPVSEEAPVVQTEPEPVAEPEPSPTEASEQEPGNLSAELGEPSVVVNPQDVTVEVGEQIVLSAKGKDYSASSWFFLAPDAEEGISIEAAMDQIDGLQVTVEIKDGAEVLTIDKALEALDGWSVYCEFSSSGNEAVRTEAAKINFTKNSTGNGGQGSPGTPNPPSGGSSTNLGHSHSWSPVYTVIHHDAEYETVHHDAVYYTGIYKVADEVPGWWETIPQTQCYCGQIFGSRAEWQAHAYSYLDTDEAFNHNGWTDASQTIWHEGTPAVYEERTVLVFEAYDEEVLIREAYDETVVDYYICDCGEKKLP